MWFLPANLNEMMALLKYICVRYLAFRNFVMVTSRQTNTVALAPAWPGLPWSAYLESKRALKFQQFQQRMLI